MMPSVPKHWLISLCFAGFTGAAQAADVPCELTESGVITVDGLADDWRGVKPVSVSQGAAADAGMAVRCNYDEDNLYLLVQVSDDRLIRAKGAPGADDHLVFAFGDKRLEVFPADTDKNVKATVRWAGGGSTKGVDVVDSLQPKGWLVELGIGLERVPGGGKRAALIPFSLELHDGDQAVDKRPQTILSTGNGALLFAEASALLDAFLAEHKLKPQDLTLDVLADVDGSPGKERIVAGGRVAAVIGAELAYIELPVQKPSDVLEMRVIDLGGQGRSSLLGRYVERGGGGSREILAVWNVGSDGTWTRTFAHEIAKQLGKNRLTNAWELVPKKKGKKKLPGYDLVIKHGDLVGFTQETWNEIPAEDMQPILLPWSGANQETWRFADGEVTGGAE
jgi:hypothetical protein